MAWPPPCPRPGWGVPFSPHGVQTPGGLVVGAGRPHDTDQDTGHQTPFRHQAEVRCRSGDSLFIEQRPGPRQPTPGASQNLRPQSNDLSAVPPASQGPRAWTRLGSREAATETRTHTGRTSCGDRGGGALSTARSRRSAALTPTARKDSLCPTPRPALRSRRPGATSTPRVQATLSKETEFIFK